MMQKRVLHVIDDLGLGGAERLLGTLLPEVRMRGFNPIVASLGCRAELAGPLEAAGIRVLRCGLNPRKEPVRAIASLRSLIRREQSDLVHTHLTFANLYGRMAARLSRVPVTTTYHDADYEQEVLVANPTMKQWKQTVYRLADRATTLGAPRVIAVSEYVAASVRRRLGYAQSAVEVIYNGVPSRAWSQVGAEMKRASRSELGLPMNSTIVLQVGRLTPQKGHTHTLKVASALRGQSDLHWVFVGEGPLSAELRRSISVAGLEAQVMMIGARTDVRSFL